jgi:two-component system, cell cycle sensor histidine kinase and response regulator CckA
VSSGNRSSLIRYALSFLIFGIVTAIAFAVRYYDLQINLSLLVMAGLVIAAWYLGRGPGLLLLGMMWLAALVLTPSQSNASLPLWIISQVSVLAVFAFIILLVSGRRSNEQALRRQSEFFRTTLSSIGDGVISTDVNGRITFINLEAEDLTGCPSEDALDRPLAEILDLKRESTGEPLVGIVTDVRRNGSAIAQNEDLILRSCKGGEVPVILNAAPIKDVDGAFLGAVIVFQNVTSRRESEKAVLESEARLLQAQKIEAVGTLTGGIAHDFNNLLTAILGHTQLALRKLAEHDPVRRSLIEVEKAGNRGAVLTKKLLAFSRRQHLDRHVIDLNKAIDEMLSLMERVIGANITVTFRKDEALPPVFADPAQIEQVVMNMTLNARDAMPAGGRLAIETRVVDLDEYYARQYPDCKPGRYSQIIVSDTGIGIEPEAMDRIFEPFYTTKDVDKGTGLGLAMAYGIVKQHGGHINVYSEPGRGTTFKIFLPAVEHDVAAKRGEPTVSMAGGTETILVADDEEALRELSRDVLEELGYTVLMAENGEHAVELYQENADRIDLLLFDVVMPALGGSEAYRRIVELAGRRVPLVLMTGYSEEILNSPYVKQGEFIDLEEVTVIQKPYTLEALGRTVRKVLDGNGSH